MHVNTTVNSAKQSPTEMNQKQPKDPLYKPYSWKYSLLPSTLHITTISTIANCPRENHKQTNYLRTCGLRMPKIGGMDEAAVQWEQGIRFQWC